MGEKKKRGIDLTTLFIVFVAVLLVVAVSLFVETRRSEVSIREMQEITNEYIAGQDAINDMREASDFLTEQSRSFVVSGNKQCAEAYYKEVEVNKRREESLETIKKYEDSEKIYESLSDALNESDTLADREGYAMRLACEGYGIDPSGISEIVAKIQLKEADRSLDRDGMLTKSREMLFDEDYETMKDEIITDVINGTDDLVEATHDRQVASYEKTMRVIRTEHTLLGLIMITTILMLVLTAVLIVAPLRKSTSYIRGQLPLPVTGAREYAYLAETYNGMLEQTKKHHEELSYEATHDELTGVFNRKMFETTRAELADEDIAMLIVDVDYFKSVNDTYGHEMGDRVLKKIADILTHSFRLEDYVCRIGGDEFTVMMVQMKPELAHVVEQKIGMVRDKLAEADELPKVTLSIGAAFSADEGDDDIFKKADKALYKTKEDGRDGYNFYKDI